MHNVIVIGATGAVGRELLAILEAGDFPVASLRACASERSIGRSIDFRGESIPLEMAEPTVFEGADFAFFCAGRTISQAMAPEAVARGCTVIDNSSAFRGEPGCPLVVPEVNPQALEGFSRAGIIANPNCSTIIALVAISPLRQLARINRITACTYQAVSGAGQAAMVELENQARAWAAGEPLPADVFGSETLFNCFSHESPIGPDGMNEEERKLQVETRRIWNDQDVRVSATCVRIPVLRAHTEALHLEFDGPISPEDARMVLSDASGVRLDDDPQPARATGLDEVLVGRIRRDHGVADNRGLALLACGDQLRKGAALNAVQIVDTLVATKA
ncbi:MAG: aspartate-semialdehyde dehydrogenase [Phycisphaerales bacterium]|nr:aspartate-semialdehyde dehydrogenase [Phycisphaerales bacterium]